MAARAWRPTADVFIGAQRDPCASGGAATVRTRRAATPCCRRPRLMRRRQRSGALRFDVGLRSVCKAARSPADALPDRCPSATGLRRAPVREMSTAPSRRHGEASRRGDQPVRGRSPFPAIMLMARPPLMGFHVTKGGRLARVLRRRVATGARRLWASPPSAIHYNTRHWSRQPRRAGSTR